MLGLGGEGDSSMKVCCMAQSQTVTAHIIYEAQTKTTHYICPSYLTSAPNFIPSLSSLHPQQSPHESQLSCKLIRS